MAYLTPPTKSDGNILTAAEWNTYVRQNMIDTPPDVFTQAGQLLIGTGVDSASLLAPGGEGYFLRANSAQALGVDWDVFDKGLVQFAQTTLANSTTTRLQMASLAFSVGSISVNTTNDWVSVGRAGYYRLGWRMRWHRNGATIPDAAYFEAYLYFNGALVSTLCRFTSETALIPNQWESLYFTGHVLHEATGAGSYYIDVFQNSGSTSTFVSGDSMSQLSVMRI